MKNLSDICLGERAEILGLDVACPPAKRQRFLDLGFVKGAQVKLEAYSPLNDPIAYLIHGTLISLRREDARLIRVQSEQDG